MKKTVLLLSALCITLCILFAACKSENDIFEYSSKTDGTYYISGFTSDVNSDDITSLDIPSTYNGKEITGISKNAFKDCVNLTSITIPDTVTTIKSYAFSGCTSLTSISISDNIAEIESGAFENCNALEYYTYNNGYYLGNSSNNYVVLIKGIDNTATSFIVNDSCKVIYQEALSGFKNLISIDMSDSIKDIGYSAFSSCTSLKSFVIPNQVTSMDISWFSQCSSLKSITLGAKMSEVSIGYMWGCDSFEEFKVVTSNSNFTAVDGVLYSKDKKILQCYPKAKTGSNFSIPSYVETINTYAFNGCIYLESLSMWTAVTKLNKGAVINCDSLHTINYTGTMNEWILLDNANSDWDSSKTVNKIVCSDGTITRTFS